MDSIRERTERQRTRIRTVFLTRKSSLFEEDTKWGFLIQAPELKPVLRSRKAGRCAAGHLWFYPVARCLFPRRPHPTPLPLIICYVTTLTETCVHSSVRVRAHVQGAQNRYSSQQKGKEVPAAVVTTGRRGIRVRHR